MSNYSRTLACLDALEYLIFSGFQERSGIIRYRDDFLFLNLLDTLVHGITKHPDIFSNEEHLKSLIAIDYGLYFASENIERDQTIHSFHKESDFQFYRTRNDDKRTGAFKVINIISDFEKKHNIDLNDLKRFNNDLSFDSLKRILSRQIYSLLIRPKPWPPLPK